MAPSFNLREDEFLALYEEGMFIRVAESKFVPGLWFISKFFDTHPQAHFAFDVNHRGGIDALNAFVKKVLHARHA